MAVAGGRDGDALILAINLAWNIGLHGTTAVCYRLQSVGLVTSDWLIDKEAFFGKDAKVSL